MRHHLLAWLCTTTILLVYAAADRNVAMGDGLTQPKVDRMVEEHVDKEKKKTTKKKKGGGEDDVVMLHKHDGHSHDDHVHSHPHDDHVHSHPHDDHHNKAHQHDEHSTHDHDHHHHHHEIVKQDHLPINVVALLTTLSTTTTIPPHILGALLGALFISVMGNVGILAFVFFKVSSSVLNVMVAFAVGGLLGDVFLHLLPHTNHYPNGGYWILAGILTFFVIEKLVLRRVGNHTHSHSSSSHHHIPAPSISKPKKIKGEKPTDGTRSRTKSPAPSSPPPPAIIPKPGAILNFIADFAHNFIDGMAIACAFQASITLGISTTTAVLLHEIPHEMGDFAVLVSQGMSNRSAIAAQFVSAIGAMLGCVFGFMVTSEQPLPALCFTAGGFIYVSLADILPQILSESSSLAQTALELMAMLAAIAIMAGIAELEDDHVGHSHSH